MMARRLTLLAMLALSACGTPALHQEAVGPGALPPITADYRGSILAWARRSYVDRRTLAHPRLSEPELIRDSSGRLLWLVCLEVENRGRPDPDLRAFGFAPNYFSAPLQRNGSSLVADYCRERRLAWTPFPELLRS